MLFIHCLSCCTSITNSIRTTVPSAVAYPGCCRWVVNYIVGCLRDKRQAASTTHFAPLPNPILQLQLQLQPSLGYNDRFSSRSSASSSSVSGLSLISFELMIIVLHLQRVAWSCSKTKYARVFPYRTSWLIYKYKQTMRKYL